MNNYYFTSEHQLFRKSLRDFLNREIVPHIDHWEEEGEIPKSAFKKPVSYTHLRAHETS